MNGSNENLTNDQQQSQQSNESTEHLKHLFCEHFKLDSNHVDLTNDFKSLLKDFTLDFDSLNKIFQVNNKLILRHT